MSTDQLTALLPFLIPLFIIEVGLIVAALLDLTKRQHVRGENKVVWVLVILLLGVIGPIVYFIFGRETDGPPGDSV